MNTVETLRRAKEELQGRGWCQGELVDADGHVCALGAINCAVYGEASPQSDDEKADAAALLLSSVIEMCDDEGYTKDDVGEWNDHEDRTLGEVLEAFDKAIAAAEVLP